MEMGRKLSKCAKAKIRSLEKRKNLRKGKENIVKKKKTPVDVS